MYVGSTAGTSAARSCAGVSVVVVWFVYGVHTVHSSGSRLTLYWLSPVLGQARREAGREA